MHEYFSSFLYFLFSFLLVLDSRFLALFSILYFHCLILNNVEHFLIPFLLATNARIFFFFYLFSFLLVLDSRFLALFSFIYFLFSWFLTLDSWLYFLFSIFIV